MFAVFKPRSPTGGRLALLRLWPGQEGRQRLTQGPAHRLHVPLTVHLQQLPLRPVVVDEGSRLPLVDGQATAHGLRLVVAALIKPPPALVARAGPPRRAVAFVIDGAAGAAGPAPPKAGQDLVLVYLDRRRPLQGETASGQGPVQGLGLVAVAREAVQDGAPSTVRPAQALQEHVDGKLVRDQLTTAVVLLYSPPQL